MKIGGSRRAAQSTSAEASGVPAPRRRTPPRQARPQPRPPVPASHSTGSAPSHIVFSGEPPRSWSRGLEPAFLLLETALIEELRRKAAASGTTYDVLLKTILRRHIHQY